MKHPASLLIPVLALCAAPLAAQAGQDAPGSQDPRDQRLDELERRVDLIAEGLETVSLGDVVAPTAEQGVFGLGPASSRVYLVEQGVSIGGYGEVLYQNFAMENDLGLPSGKKDTADLLRAVLYFGYKFDESLVLNTEIEFEHASTGKRGEVSVEFAYLDWLIEEEINGRGGLLLIPMGFINEVHEPTTFFSAQRPGVERFLIPTTWREIGVGVHGDLGPFSYRSYLVDGFDASGFSSLGVRGGRQKGSIAKAEDWATVTRVDLTGVPGLLVGGSAYLGYSGQGLMTPAGGDIGAGISIFEGHAEWSWRGLRARVLGVYTNLNDVRALNAALGLTGAASLGEKMHGWYAELGFDVLSLGEGHDMALTPFIRWEELDTQARVPAGFVRDPATDADILTVGLAFQPLDQIIVKIDFQDISNAAGTGVDQFNAAIGWIF